MPDLMIVHEYACAQNENWQTEVTGSKGTNYTVRFDRFSHKNQGSVERDFSCDCKAYKFRQGDCKHINEVRDQKCTWMDGEPNDNDGEQTCPVCGGEVIIYRKGV